MKLTRAGAHRNHGRVDVINKPIKSPRFDGEKRTLLLEARDKDPINGSTYNYKLELSLDEVGDILEALDRVPAAQRRPIGDGLRLRTRSLLRLAHLSAGVPVDDSGAA
ncbi:MAG: hypothetical protein K2Y23_09525 [Cyanobacteria bacterium]|nr:hypothetical protein [Cyanobacteriota bacterium]